MPHVIKALFAISCDTKNDEANGTSATESICSESQLVYSEVYNFCEDLIANPRVVEFRVIKEAFFYKVSERGVDIPELDKKNLTRKIKNKFPELRYVHYQYNKALVYPETLSMDEIVLNNLLKSELQALSVDKSEDDVIRVARLLHSEVKSHQAQMSWPPNESELTPDKISSYIPHLLDVFLTVLISGHSLNSDKSKTERTLRLKESFGQDIVFVQQTVLSKPPKVYCFHQL